MWSIGVNGQEKCAALRRSNSLEVWILVVSATIVKWSKWSNQASVCPFMTPKHKWGLILGTGKLPHSPDSHGRCS
jgi:hypothetical protein